MNYQESIAYIHQTPKFARELGNRKLKKLLEHLNNPQESLRVIHLAGTNGKGSTAAMIANSLTCAGYRCGLYTSPYIERFNERIRIDGEEIPDDDLARIITKIRELIETYDAPVSEFALDTAAAFCYFEEEKCDFVVLETGMGGRLDATNVIQNPFATVLTAIDMDHMQYLGDTIEKIAKEKCGIIKQNCPVVCYPKQKDSVVKIIQNVAKEKNAPVYIPEIPEYNEQKILYLKKEYEIGLSGEFQGYNAATALKVLEILGKQGVAIPERAIAEGLKTAKNMARFEKFGKQVVLDGGHNASAGKALCRALKLLQKPIYFCVAMMEDKDCKGFLREIEGVANGIVFSKIEMPRCATAETLAELVVNKKTFVQIENHPFLAIEQALALAGDDGIVCICGSLYFAGMVRPFLREKFKNSDE